MRSFRQYLQEENGNTELPVFYQQFKFTTNETGVNVRQPIWKLTDKMSVPAGVTFSNLRIKVEVDAVEVYVYLRITNESHASDDKLLPFLREFQGNLQQLDFVQDAKVRFGQMRLWVVHDTLPPFTISGHAVRVGEPLRDEKMPKSLHDCHKLLDFTAINLVKPQVVEECVLGLLTMKKLTNLNSLQVPSPQWLKIIEKHFLSKDLIECKEEMMEAGLKEYARL